MNFRIFWHNLNFIYQKKIPFQFPYEKTKLDSKNLTRNKKSIVAKIIPLNEQFVPSECPQVPRVFLLQPPTYTLYDPSWAEKTH